MTSVAEADFLPTRSPLRPKRSRNRSQSALVSFAGLVVLLFAIAASVFLVRVPQDIRNQAFTGFVSRFDGETTNVPGELRFADSSDIPQSSEFSAEGGQRAAFYAMAQQYQNDQPEYQEISLPEYLLYGQVFLVTDQTANTSTLFARIIGFPEELVGESARVWIESKTGTYTILGNIDIETENEVPVAYVTYVGPGNIKDDSITIHFSHDTAESDGLRVPGFISLSVGL